MIIKLLNNFINFFVYPLLISIIIHFVFNKDGIHVKTKLQIFFKRYLASIVEIILFIPIIFYRKKINSIVLFYGWLLFIGLLPIVLIELSSSQELRKSNKKQTDHNEYKDNDINRLIKLDNKRDTYGDLIQIKTTIPIKLDNFMKQYTNVLMKLATIFYSLFILLVDTQIVIELLIIIVNISKIIYLLIIIIFKAELMGILTTLVFYIILIRLCFTQHYIQKLKNKFPLIKNILDEDKENLIETFNIFKSILSKLKLFSKKK